MASKIAVGELASMTGKNEGEIKNILIGAGVSIFGGKCDLAAATAALTRSGVCLKMNAVPPYAAIGGTAAKDAGVK